MSIVFISNLYLPWDVRQTNACYQCSSQYHQFVYPLNQSVKEIFNSPPLLLERHSKGVFESYIKDQTTLGIFF